MKYLQYQIIKSCHNIFKNIETNFLATRYHSLIIDRNTLSKDFIITAETNNKTIMGIAHLQLPIYGCLLYTSPSPRDATLSRMPSSA